jgi:hypothetical protein
VGAERRPEVEANLADAGWSDRPLRWSTDSVTWYAAGGVTHRAGQSWSRAVLPKIQQARSSLSDTTLSTLHLVMNLIKSLSQPVLPLQPSNFKESKQILSSLPCYRLIPQAPS